MMLLFFVGLLVKFFTSVSQDLDNLFTVSINTFKLYIIQVTVTMQKVNPV